MLFTKVIIIKILYAKHIFEKQLNNSMNEVAGAIKSTSMKVQRIGQ